MGKRHGSRPEELRELPEGSYVGARVRHYWARPQRPFCGHQKGFEKKQERRGVSGVPRPKNPQKMLLTVCRRAL